MIHFIRKISIACTLVLLAAFSSMAQDTLSRSAAVTGGRWLSSGSLTTFNSAGQLGVSSLLTADSLATDSTSNSIQWSGSVGFLGPILNLRENNAPVAVSINSLLLESGDPITLEGFDPDGDSIIFEIVTAPNNGTVDLIPGTTSQFVFSPNAGLVPETLYRDSLLFVVKEVNGGLSSETAKVRFRFRLTDEGHTISDIFFEGDGTTAGTLTLQWQDPVFNANYAVDVNYYDLTNVNNPVFRSLYRESNPAASYNVEGNQLSLDIAAAAADHPYLFEGSKVFVTALVATPNGNSDFTTYIIDNTTGGRVDASEDGLFFAFGSEMSVIENKRVSLNLVAVELGDFGIANASIEILQSGSQGTINVPSVKGSNANTKTWLLTYESTEQVGGLDSIQFRVYNPERQEFDTAWASIEIVDVNDAPKIVAVADQLTEEEVPLTIGLNFNDPDSEVEVFVESNERTKVPVSYADGQITISPATDYSGRVSVNVVVTEIGTEEEYVAFDRFDVDITPVNDAPVVAAVTDKTIDEDNALTLVLSATDSDAELPVFDYSGTIDQPSRFDIVVDGNSITYTPKANINGAFVASVFADDRLGTATSKSEARTFNLIVTPVNDAPVALKSFPSQTLVSGFPAYNINLAAYFNDVENGSDLTYSADGNVNVQLTFNGTQMNVTALEGFVDSEDVTIYASDGEDSVSQQITFIAAQQSVNIIVSNAPETVELLEDFGTFTLDVSSVFTDQNNPNAVFSYELVGGNFLQVAIDANTGIITFISTDEYFGSESLYLIASTGGQSSYIEFTVNVSPVNDPPTIASIGNLVMQEDLVLRDLFIEVGDIDSENLTISATSSNLDVVTPEGITFVETTGGYLMTVTPLADQFGVSSLEIIVSDGEDTVSTRTTVNVQSVNDRPTVLVTTLDNPLEDDLYLVDVTELFSDIEGDQLFYTVTSMPQWATYASQLISGTPENANVGPAIITIRAEDGNGGQTTASYDINVVNVNDAPTLVSEIADVTAFQDNAWTFNFPVTAFEDVDAGDQLTYAFDVFPDWATVNGTTLSGTPDYEDIGEYDLEMSATDLSGAKVSAMIKVIVEFTSYSADVSVSFSATCSNGRFTVTASGAVSYNWYDAEGELIGVNQEFLVLEPGNYGIEGLDALGRSTNDRVTFEVVNCSVLSELLPKELSFYPNPSQDYIIVEGADDSFAFEVYDALGKRYQAEVAGSANQVKIDLRKLPSGMYFMKYDFDGKSKVHKIIKVN